MAEVSVIIPMLNAYGTIERAIVSVLYQGVDTQIIIVDDCSDDGSDELVTTLAEKYPANISLIKSKQRLGVSAARNLALESVTTPYVAFLDADDIWLRTKLIKQLEIIRSSEDIAIVSCDCYKVSPDGNILARTQERNPPVRGVLAWKTLLSYNFMPTPSILTRTDLLRRVGGFRNDLVVAEDLDLWIRLGRQGRIEIIDEVLVHYFDYQGSLMKRSGRDSTVLVLDMINKHMDDAVFDQEERRAIMAHRYFELGKHCLGYGDKDTMRLCFKEARNAGFSDIQLLLFQLRQWLKSILPLRR